MQRALAKTPYNIISYKSFEDARQEIIEAQNNEPFGDYISFENTPYLPAFFEKHMSEERNNEMFKEILFALSEKYLLREQAFVTFTIPHKRQKITNINKKIAKFETIRQQDAFFNRVWRNIVYFKDNYKLNFEFAYSKEMHNSGDLHLHAIFYAEQDTLKKIIRYINDNYKYRAEIRIHKSLLQGEKIHKTHISTNRNTFVYRNQTERIKSGTAVMLTTYDEQHETKKQVFEYLIKYMGKKQNIRKIKFMQEYKKYIKETYNETFRSRNHSEIGDLNDYRDNIYQIRKAGFDLSDYRNNKFKIDREIDKQEFNILDKTFAYKTILTTPEQTIKIKKIKPQREEMISNEKYIEDNIYTPNGKKVDAIIITGKAGTGKTKKLIDTYEYDEKGNNAIISYTAARAQMLIKTYGVNAMTIHRFLKAMPIDDDTTLYLRQSDDTIRNSEKIKTIFIDELSIIPRNLLLTLIRYCQNNNIRIVATADYRQIAKNTLRDFGKYLNIKFIRQTKVYRKQNIREQNIKEKDIQEYYDNGWKIITNDYNLLSRLERTIKTDKYIILKNMDKVDFNTGEIIRVFNSQIVRKIDDFFYETERGERIRLSKYDFYAGNIKKFVGLTVLKSQGSEFKKVLYIRADKDDRVTKYTAETRATEECITTRVVEKIRLIR